MKARIRRAIDCGACDALLLNVNQIGTLTEAAEACRLARAAGWMVTISVRSGETEDDWAADLAGVGPEISSRTAPSRNPSGWPSTTACSRLNRRPGGLWLRGRVSRLGRSPES
jgi:hypothetical protein